MKTFYPNNLPDLEPRATGYDFKNQAWVKCGTYVNYGHPEEMDCGCYGRKHYGEPCLLTAEELNGYWE